MRPGSWSAKTIPFFAIALAAAWFGTLVWLLVQHYDQFFWDYRTYHFAAVELLKGNDPYGPSNVPAGLKHYSELFVYAPPVARLFIPFAQLGYPGGLFAMFALKCALLLGLVWLWVRRVLAGAIDAWFFLFCLLAFSSSVAIDLRCGNIVTFEATLIWLGLVCFLEDRPRLFGVFIVMAALVKLTPLLFLGLYLFWAPDRRRWGLAALYVSVFTALMFGSYLVWPGEFSHFVANVRSAYNERGLICPSLYNLVRDSCRVFGALLGTGTPPWLIQALGGLVTVVVARFSLRTLERLRMLTPEADRRRCTAFFFCLAYALLVPRFKDYSFMLLIPPAYLMIRKVELKSSYPMLFFLMILMPVARDTTYFGFDRLFLFLREFYQLWLAAGLWLLYRAYVAWRLTGKDLSLVSFREG